MRRIFDIRKLPAVTVVLITVFFFVVYVFMPYSGDDLAYLGAFHGLNGTPTGYYDAVSDFFPRWVARHWVYVNGRFANNLFALMGLWYPRMINSAIVSLAAGAMIYMTMRLSRLYSRDVIWKMLLIAVMVFALPWWDSFMVYDVMFNYVVSSAILLGVVYIYYYRIDMIDKSSRIYLVLWCIFFFVAGGMHEAASIPVLISTLIYMWLRNDFKGMSKNAKLVGISYTGGAMLCFLSPGIWMRFSTLAEPDDPLILLLLKSDIIPLLLFIVIGFNLTTKTGRNMLKDLSATPWLIFVMATFVSCLFSAVSGIVGRSGWFASIFALIALFNYIGKVRFHINIYVVSVFSFIIFVAILFHYFEYAKWQIRMYGEVEEMTNLYREADNGIVYMDETRDTAVPWWVLNKTRGVPDADDYYQKLCFDEYYGGGKKKLVVLPAQLNGMDLRNIAESIILRNGDMLMKYVPTGAYVHDISREHGKYVLWDDAIGDTYVVTPFKKSGDTFYHLSQQIIDPGDR